MPLIFLWHYFWIVNNTNLPDNKINHALNLWQTEGVRVDRRSQFKEMLTKNALVPWKVRFEYEEVKKAEVDKHCQQDKEPNIRAVILT